LTPERTRAFGFAAMKRVTQWMALCLLALWLPATQHCALEAVGALSVTCSNHGSTAESSKGDACSAIEDGSYKPAGQMLRVSAPCLIAVVIFQCPPLALSDPGPALPVSGESVREAEAWLPTWQFVRRAAPLPGAPSELLA